MSHYSTAEETLLASVKKNDIANVLYALALSANPNARDRSRNTHVVFLALAAADPASPSASTTPTTITSPVRPVTPQTPRKAFPVAELLLQNGAELPVLPAPIPLSLSARAYLDVKAERSVGNRIVGSGLGKGDVLPQLPNIVAGNGTSPREREREREARLLKRGSASARLVHKPPGV